MSESRWDIPPAIIEEAQKWRHWLHQHPELSMQEFNTSAFIRKVLDQYGIKYVFPAPGTETGVLALLGRGPFAVGFRAELDALPITERTGLPFQSVNKGVMHACGHDVHMAILLGFLAYLKSAGKEPSRYRVIGIFQPSEEKAPGGANMMVQDGLIERFRIKYMFAQHVEPALSLGTIGVHPGPFMASSDELYITIKGHSGHAAQPHKHPNPIIAASAIINFIYSFQMQMHSPVEPFLINLGKICGGTTTNIVPASVEIAGTIRAFNEETRLLAHKALKEKVPLLAKTHNCKAKTEIISGYPVLVNDNKLTNELKTAFEQAGFNVTQVPPRMGSDDFAFFSQEVPSLYWRLGARSGNESSTAYLHSDNIIIPDEVIPFGIKALITVAETMNLLES